MKPKCLKMYISHILRIVNCLRPVREFFTDMATSPRTGEWMKKQRYALGTASVHARMFIVLHLL